MYTPNQASQLWCPMVRTARREVPNDEAPNSNIQVVGGCNTGGRAARVPSGARCVSIECSMWRWADGAIRPKRIVHADNTEVVNRPARPKDVPDNYQFVPFDKDEGNSAAWVEPTESAQARRTGFCGLAGRVGAL